MTADETARSGKDAALENLAYGVLASIIIVPGIVVLAIKYVLTPEWNKHGWLTILEHMLQPKEMADAWLGWFLVASGVVAVVVFWTRAALCVWRRVRAK